MPLAGLAHRVRQRNALLVKAADHAVDVGLVVVGVEDLQLISGVFGAGRSQEQSAVATQLARAGNVFGNSPFDMELLVPEGALGLNIASGFIYCDHTVGDDPFRRGRAVLRRHPLVQILAVEQDDCVRGRCSAGSARHYHPGLRLPDFGVFRFGCGLLGVERDGRGAEKAENHEREKVPHLCAHDVQEHTPKVESDAVVSLRRFLNCVSGRLRSLTG